MKNLIWATAILLFASSFVFTSCDSPDRNVNNTDRNANSSEENLRENRQDNQMYLTEVENFRRESANRVEANNRKIAEYNAVAVSDRNETHNQNRTRITELERQNADLNRRLTNYNHDKNNRDDWEKFKTDFNRDMEKVWDELRVIEVKTYN